MSRRPSHEGMKPAHAPLWGTVHRQVFGLTGVQLAYWPSLPSAEHQCFMTAVVPDYRCGAVPAFHRIPFSAARFAGGHRLSFQHNGTVTGGQGEEVLGA